MAVSGFLMLLSNFNTLAGNFMSSQSASQSSCVCSSQVCNAVKLDVSCEFLLAAG